MMEDADDDQDLKLVKLSIGLLGDLEQGLERILWKRKKSSQSADQFTIHSCVKKRDLDWVVQLIEPFQGDPQLLDAKLKTLVPPLVTAYLAHLRSRQARRQTNDVEYEIAVCMLLHTFCKVRGYKVILGFFNNEPKYLELVVEELERVTGPSQRTDQAWQVQHILLLWLTHLLLTPFDLASISTTTLPAADKSDGSWLSFPHVSSLASRILRLALIYLPARSKTQEAAALLLVRLITRPDVQKNHTGDSVVREQLKKLQDCSADPPSDIYQRLGALRFLARVCTSVELLHLIPEIYRYCDILANAKDNAAAGDAVTKKLLVKTFRNVAVLALRNASSAEFILNFVQDNAVLENIIDYLLRSLSDNDTPVRYAAAKAISTIVLELDPDMGCEITQAVLVRFIEDMPSQSQAVDFSTASPLKWHGLTLALAHVVFKRSASPEQLPDILNALIAALQFQQRSATGTMLGTNVRDAANFGIWSLSRRYKTAELFSVRVKQIQSSSVVASNVSVIQCVAIELILSACLDPVGNIRRGASAALQELIGRHPGCVHEGIALVQILDYQAVGLRQRAMLDVVSSAAVLHTDYRLALIDGLFGWRGLGSSDAVDRENASSSIARLAVLSDAFNRTEILQRALAASEQCSEDEAESLHGLALTLAKIIGTYKPATSISHPERTSCVFDKMPRLWASVRKLQSALLDFSPRVLRSRLPASIGNLLIALSSLQNTALTLPESSDYSVQIPWDNIDAVTELLLSRYEEPAMRIIPSLVGSQSALKHTTGKPLSYLAISALAPKVAADGAKSSIHGAGRALALGTLATQCESSAEDTQNFRIASSTLNALFNSTNVDWRVVGGQALLLLIERIQSRDALHSDSLRQICAAIHDGLNDYTIDERGDVGSLVRLQAITCATEVLSNSIFQQFPESVQILKADIIRLSLEKLDKVRFQAALCHQRHLDVSVTDVARTSTFSYFEKTLQPLGEEKSPPWLTAALLEGCISCAGISAEPLLQASRRALALRLEVLSLPRLEYLMSTYVQILANTAGKPNANLHPALELLAFLLDMNVLNRLINSPLFKWRSLLSAVQKSHYKSSDIPKILVALRVYVGLAEVPSIRDQVVKKLFGMLRTNPYPRIRSMAAQGLWLVTRDARLKEWDWSKRTTELGKVVETLEREFSP